jgi:hypothetical protein
VQVSSAKTFVFRMYQAPLPPRLPATLAGVLRNFPKCVWSDGGIVLCTLYFRRKKIYRSCCCLDLRSGRFPMVYHSRFVCISCFLYKYFSSEPVHVSYLYLTVSTNHEASHYAVFSIFAFHRLLKPWIFPSPLHSQISSEYFFYLRVWDKVSHICKNHMCN